MSDGDAVLVTGTGVDHDASWQGCQFAEERQAEVHVKRHKAAMALGALAMLGGTFGGGHYAGNGYIGKVPGPDEAPRPALQPSNPVQERRRRRTGRKGR